MFIYLFDRMSDGAEIVENGQKFGFLIESVQAEILTKHYCNMRVVGN